MKHVTSGKPAKTGLKILICLVYGIFAGVFLVQAYQGQTSFVFAFILCVIIAAGCYVNLRFIK